ncbi:hypothetical protein WN48_01396 [Eufriesea mexicana]|uniref:Ubiquitin carboxyl-terminal hydrolase MINDY n=1 Tax=Eufriesea mexicana TaxID=516756 RepID=A0A310SRF1_9HYME|nr:hypothetical protein WN48_01396 [Eufriesea mexicana]
MPSGDTTVVTFAKYCLTAGDTTVVSRTKYRSTAGNTAMVSCARAHGLVLCSTGPLSAKSQVSLPDFLKLGPKECLVSGFYFSPDEPTALIQTNGGPCAVIAPVQAFILKELLSEPDVSAWKNINRDTCYQLLVRASIEILKQAAGEKVPKFCIVFMDCKFSNDENGRKAKWVAKIPEIENREEEISVGNNESQEKSNKILRMEMNEECRNVDSDFFHSQLRDLTLNIDCILFSCNTNAWRLESCTMPDADGELSKESACPRTLQPGSLGPMTTHCVTQSCFEN